MGLLFSVIYAEMYGKSSQKPPTADEDNPSVS